MSSIIAFQKQRGSMEVKSHSVLALVSSTAWILFELWMDLYNCWCLISGDLEASWGIKSPIIPLPVSRVSIWAVCFQTDLVSGTIIFSSRRERKSQRVTGWNCKSNLAWGHWEGPCAHSVAKLTEADLFFSLSSLLSSLSGLSSCLVSFEVPLVPGFTKRNLLRLTLFVICIYTVGN